MQRAVTQDAKVVASRGSKWRLWLWKPLRVFLLVYMGVILSLAFLENSLVYFPSRYPNGDWNVPSGAEEARFNSADGTKLHGWFVSTDSPRAVVLFLHGNGGSIAGRRDLIDTFRRLNVAALLFDYRGYGRSEGSPNEQGVLADSRAARAWIANRTGVPEKEIVLWGESLGGGVAVDLASDGTRGVVLESTFTSIPDVAAYHYRFLPVRWLMSNRYDSLSKIAGYHGPLLQAHGDADTIVPYVLGRQLFEAAKEPKQFLTIPNGDHNDARTQLFWVAVDKFLDSL